MIDVGGPSMLRAAAKNFAHVAPRVPARAVRARARRSCAQRRRALARRRDASSRRRRSRRPPPTRRRSRAGSRDGEAFPETLVAVVHEGARPRATARTRTSAARTTPRHGARVHLLSRVEQLHGKELSYNNLNDLSAARLLAARVHAAGLRDRQAREPVRRRGRGDDRGGLRARARLRPGVGLRHASSSLNRPVRRRARRGARGAVRRGAASRPATTTAALEALKAKPAHADPARPRAPRARPPASATTSACSAGCSSRTATGTSRTARGWRSSAATRREEQWGDLLFAWRVCKHVGSNAIVLAKDLQTIGIGAGQTSRVDAVRIALEKAREHGHDLDAAQCSPPTRSSRSPDGPQLALDAGVDGDRSSRAARSATTRSSRRSRRRARRWCFTGRRHFRH